MGRSRKVTGPFADNMGIDMLQGGGKLFLGSGGRYVGPGHFGLLDLGDGVQKFSMHFEADLDRGGASVLDIRPLRWRDRWPVAGENVKGGGEVVALAGFTGSPEQLWRIDQFADGTYRVMPKAVPNSEGPLALSAIGSSKPTLATFNAASDRQRWLFKAP